MAGLQGIVFVCFCASQCSKIIKHFGCEMLRVSDFHVSPAFRFSALGCEQHREETADRLEISAAVHRKDCYGIKDPTTLGQSKELVKRKNNMRGEEKNTDMYNHLHSRACIHFSFIAMPLIFYARVCTIICTHVHVSIFQSLPSIPLIFYARVCTIICTHVHVSIFHSLPSIRCCPLSREKGNTRLYHPNVNPSDPFAGKSPLL